MAVVRLRVDFAAAGHDFPCSAEVTTHLRVPERTQSHHGVRRHRQWQDYEAPQIAAEFAWYERPKGGEPGQALVALPMRPPTIAAFRRFCDEADVLPGTFVGCRTRAAKLGDRTAKVLFVTQGYLAQVMSDGILQRAAALVVTVP